MIQEMEAVALEAVGRMGALIREHMGSVSLSEIHNKGPSDYVTEIDKKSESLIMDMIRKRFPDHHIMSEETPHSGWKNDISWVIDPLDGTTNFIHGFPFVAVSIAVCVERRPVLGFVLDPVRGELFTARRGQGACLNGKPIRAREVRNLDEALVATGFPFRRKHLIDPYLDTFKAVFREVSGIRRGGSAALDLAYLAAGRVDGFWEIGLQPWDIAAGSLLVTEAGGVVDDFWGRGEHLLNGHVVAGGPLVHPFLLRQVQTFLAPALQG